MIKISKSLNDMNFIGSNAEILGHSVKAVLQKTAKSLFIAFTRFKENRGVLRASALTFYSLLSIVPVMAMAFGIAKGFGFEKLLQKELMSNLPGQEEAAIRIIEFSEKLLTGTKGGLMAALGIILLIWTVIKMMGHMEAALNEIWWIKRGRTLMRKFTDYTALFFTAPIVVILSGSLTVFIKARLNHLISTRDLFHLLDTTVPLLFKLIPFISMSCIFIFLYRFIPNKLIDMKAAIAGGIIAGTIYQAGQMFYLYFQVGVSHYNAIYGSFAALPLFLIWVQASWIVFLFGAEISFAWENHEVFSHERCLYDALSVRLKKLLALRITLLCVQQFARGEMPLSDKKISKTLNISLQIVKKALEELKKCNILYEVNDNENPGFQPARDINTISIITVLTALENMGESISISGSIEFEALIEAMRTFDSAAKRSAGERMLKDI